MPKVKDVAGVTGDNRSTRLVFKLPKPYATGWTKYIEFNCTVERDGQEIYPSYLLDENDSFLIPYEIASNGGEIEYNLKFVSNDGTVVEKSEMSTIYFRTTTVGTDAVPEPTIDVLTYLVNNAYCSVSYQDGTSEGSTGPSLPVLTFTPMNEGGSVDTVTLNVPYLDAHGHILKNFIDAEITVEIAHISSPNELTNLTQAQVPDMAIIDDESAQGQSYYMDLYMLVGDDPIESNNWYLVHTDNPVFESVSATSANLTTAQIDNLSATIPSLKNKVLKTNANTGAIEGSETTPTELEYVHGVTSSIQTQLNGKLDKTSDPDTYARLYGVNAQGQQTIYNLDNGKNGSTVAWRDEQGHLVAENPTIAGHVATKGYVDDSIKNGTLTVITSGAETLGTFSANQSSNTTITLPDGACQYLDQSATFVKQQTPDFDGFPYRASISINDATSNMFAIIVYSEEQARSGQYASFCQTYNGGVYLYANADVGTQIIPTISIGMDYSDMVTEGTPTQGSTNPISSGGVYTALSTKAPTFHASSDATYGVGSTTQYGHVKVDSTMSDDSPNPVQNQVVKSFVNSSIATATANFLGTYDAHDDLRLTIVDSTNPTNQQIATALGTYLTNHSISATNNDYAFVSVNYPSTVDIDEYRRFKYNGTSWLYEYTLNNSSFTQAQWDTINSLITNTSDPKLGVDVKDINAHLGDGQIHVPTSSDDTGSKILTNTKNGDPTWQTVSPSNPTLAWGQESTIGTIAGQTFKVTMPANPDTDLYVKQGYADSNKNRPLLLSYAETSGGTGEITNIVYRNNSIYANPSTGSIYATKVYSNGSEVVNLADAQTITGVKTFTSRPVLNKGYGAIRSFSNTANKYTRVLSINSPSTQTILYARLRSLNTFRQTGIWIKSNGSSPVSIIQHNDISTSNIFAIRTSSNGGQTFDTLEIYYYRGGTDPFELYVDVLNTNNMALDSSVVAYTNLTDIPNYYDTLTITDLDSSNFNTLIQASTDVVHTAGNETVGGNKTFSGIVTLNRGTMQIGTADATTDDGRIELYGKWPYIDMHYGATNTDYTSRIWNNADGNLRFDIKDTSNNTATMNLSSSGYVTAPNRSYASAGNSDVLVKGHVPDLISANVGDGQISLTSSRGTAIDSFTVNQSSGKNIVLPAGSTQYQNQEVTFALQSTPDFSDYPYMASKSITGLTADMYATVTYSDAQVSSGQYAPFCQTLAGEVRLYAKSDVGMQTIPTLSVGMDDSSAQQSMSNFVTLTGAQTVAGVKTFTSYPVIQSSHYATLEFKSARTTGDLGGLSFYDGNGTLKVYQACRGGSDTDARIMINVNGSDAIRFYKDHTEIPSNRGYNASNISDVVTINTLDNYTPMVRTTGNQVIAGLKTFSGGINNTIITSSMNKAPENIGGKCLKVLHIPSTWNVGIIYRVTGTMSAILTGIIDIRITGVSMNVVNKIGSDTAIDVSACLIAINADGSKDVYIKYRQNRRYNITIEKIFDLFNNNEVTDYTSLIVYSTTLVDYPVADGVNILSVNTSTAM